MAKPNESSNRITTRAEQIISKSVLSILNSMAAGDCIHETPEFRHVLSALEFFIPEVLSEIHSEWSYEGLDGVLPLVAEKTAVRTMCILGQCILVGDQTRVPILVELQVSPTGNNLNWLECKLGARDRNGMIRTPYESPSKITKLLYSLSGNRGSIDWAYVVTFGKRTD